MLQVIFSLVLVALGMFIDAMYNGFRRGAESTAYEFGYQQAMKEEKGKQEAVREFAEAQVRPYGEQPRQRTTGVSGTFAERFKADGRATEQLR